MGILRENWTLWWAKVYFEDEPEVYKLRPVVIIEGSAFVCTALKVTSQKKDNRYNVELVQWEAAGLKKPSWVEIGKKIMLTDDSFGEMIGRLDYEDILRIMKRLRRVSFRLM